jgi:hypothetical protein
MAGRRRTGALASSIELLTGLIYDEQQRQRQRKEKAAALAEEFRYDLALERAKRGLPYTDPSTGQQIEGVPSRVPSGLEAESWTDPQTGVTYKRPDTTLTGLLEEPTVPSRPFSESGLGRTLGAVGGAIGRLFNRQPSAAPAMHPVRTATDSVTGRKVGQFADGSLKYLDTGEPYVEAGEPALALP